MLSNLMVTCLADRASTKTCTLQQKGSGVQKAIYRRERKSLYFDFFKWKPWYWSITCDCITVILRDSGCQSLSCWKHIACWAYKYPFYFLRKGGKAHFKKRVLTQSAIATTPFSFSDRNNNSENWIC